MKKIFYTIFLILSNSYLYADSVNPGKPGTINISTGIVDRTKNIGDKINDNFRMLSSTLGDVIDGNIVLGNGAHNPSSVTLQGNTLSISTIASAINTVITSSNTLWLPLDASTNTKLGGLTINGQINNVIVSHSSITTQGNALSLSTNIAQVNTIITSSSTIWLPLDATTNTKTGGLTINGQVNSVIISHSSITTQGNALSLSTNIAQVNAIITSSATIWLPLDATTNTKVGGITLNGQINNVIITHSSITTQGNAISISTNASQINTVITSSSTVWLPLDATTNTKVGGLTINGQINSVIVTHSSITTQGNALSISSNVAQINAIITSSATTWLPLDATTNTKTGGLTISGQINNVVISHSSVTTQGNLISISTNASQVNAIITSSSTIWMPLDATTNTKVGGLTLNGQINSVIVTHSSMTTQGNSISISTNAGLVNSIYSSSGTTFLLLDNSTNTKLGGFTVGGNVTATAFSGSGANLTNLPAGTIIQPYRFVAATAASQNGTHIGADQTSIVAISTTLEPLGGGEFIVREGSFTFTAGATIPWNVVMTGQGLGTKIAVNGQFNAFIVSGTLRNVNLILPSAYNNTFIILQSSGRLENIFVNGGSLASIGAPPSVSVIRTQTRGTNMRINGLRVENVGSNGAGAGTSIINSSMSVDLIIDNWRIANCFSANVGVSIFNMAGGEYKVSNGYYEGTNRILAFQGTSTGTWWVNNKFVIVGGPNQGQFTGVGMSATGHRSNINFIGNEFIEQGGAALKVIYFQGSADEQIRGGLISGNKFYVSGSDAVQPGTDTNVLGFLFHGNVFMSSSTLTDSGASNAYRDNFIAGGASRYPQDSPTPP